MEIVVAAHVQSLDVIVECSKLFLLSLYQFYNVHHPVISPKFQARIDKIYELKEKISRQGGRISLTMLTGKFTVVMLNTGVVYLPP